MALPENSIGPYNFVTLLGQVLPLRETLEMDQRGGVDGTEFTKLGEKGQPFQIVSQVDSESYDNAWQTLHGYRSLISDPPKELVVHNTPFSTFGYNVKVLAVNPLPNSPRAIRSVTGGLFPPSRAWLECVWDLIAVKNEEPAE